MTSYPPPPGNYPPPPPPGNYPPPPPPGNFPPPPPGGGFGAPPDNNLVWAILCTVLCCLPLGIVSIVKATQVNGLWAQGQHAAAQAAAEDAKKFAMWGAIVGAVVIVVAVIIQIAAGAAMMNSGY